jgi:hypothetical protein
VFYRIDYLSEFESNFFVFYNFLIRFYLLGVGGQIMDYWSHFFENQIVNIKNKKLYQDFIRRKC